MKSPLIIVAVILIASLIFIRLAPIAKGTVIRFRPHAVPTTGAYLGAHAADIPAFEQQIGRKLAIVHDYSDFPDLFPSKEQEALVSGGGMLFVDWSTYSATWSQIASGQYDTQLKAEAAVLKAYGKPIMVSFQHEMDLGLERLGDAADYVAAARHIHNVFAAAGVKNVLWVWVTTGYVPNDPLSYYPGNSYVDWIMWDPYNWYGCAADTGPKTWKSFADKVEPFYSYLTQNSDAVTNYLSKPWGLSEFGTVEGPTTTSKAQWFEAIPQDLEQQFPKLKALVYFNVDTETAQRSCNWQVDSTAMSLSGFKVAASSPELKAMP